MLSSKMGISTDQIKINQYLDLIQPLFNEANFQKHEYNQFKVLDNSNNHTKADSLIGKRTLIQMENVSDSDVIVT